MKDIYNLVPLSVIFVLMSYRRLPLEMTVGCNGHIHLYK